MVDGEKKLYQSYYRAVSASARAFDKDRISEQQRLGESAHVQ